MTIGELSTLIAIERPRQVRAPSGELEPTGWPEIGRAWSKFVETGGGQSARGEQQQTTVDATATLRAGGDVAPGDRVRRIRDESLWSVKSIREADDERRWIELGLARVLEEGP